MSNHDQPTPRWLIEPNAAGDLVAWGRVNGQLAFFVQDGDEWKQEPGNVTYAEAELGLIHVLRGDGYLIGASELPRIHDVKLLIGLVEEGPAMTRPKLSAVMPAFRHEQAQADAKANRWATVRRVAVVALWIALFCVAMKAIGMDKDLTRFELRSTDFGGSE